MNLRPRGTPIPGLLRARVLLPALGLLPAQTATAQQLAGKLEIKASAPQIFVGQRFSLLLRIGIRRELYPKRLVQPFRRRLDLPVQVQVPWLGKNPALQLLPRTNRTGLRFLLGTELARARPLPDHPASPFRWFQARLPLQALQAATLNLQGSRLLFTHAASFREDLLGGRQPIAPKQEELPAPPLPLKILPLPPKGTPIPFSGGVGKFRIQARLEPSKDKGPSLLLLLRIEGSGDLSRLRPPQLQDIPTFGSFHVMGWTREQEAGGLNLRYELVPLGKSPPKNLPPIPLSYFDPGPPAGYRLVQTPPLPLPGTLPPAAAAAPPLPRPKPSRFFGPKTLLALLSLCQGILLLTFFLVRTAPPLKAILLTLLLASLIPEAFLLPPILRPQTARVLILEPDCPLYPVPHTETRVLRKLKRGALLELIEGSDRWLHVRDASGQGWVSRSAGRVHHL